MAFEVRRALRAGEMQAKFRLVEVVRQRARQLQAGARPRVDGPEHTFLRVALQEVLDGLVSFELLPAVKP